MGPNGMWWNDRIDRHRRMTKGAKYDLAAVAAVALVLAFSFLPLNRSALALVEMIGEMALAITAELCIASVAKAIHPYPTQAEAWQKLGDAWNRARPTPSVRTWFERYLRWRR